jgi:GTPase SAR1 family protein
MLYLSKASDRLGSISDGNTVLDYDSEEIKRQVSLMTAVAPVEWKNSKFNLIDTPGLFDFEGGVSEGMRAADSALIVVSGKDGVGVGTEKAVKAALQYVLLLFLILRTARLKFTLIFLNIVHTNMQTVWQLLLICLIWAQDLRACVRLSRNLLLKLLRSFLKNSLRVRSSPLRRLLWVFHRA